MFNSYIEEKNEIIKDYNHHDVHGDAPGGDHHDDGQCQCEKHHYLSLLTLAGWTGILQAPLG